MDNILGKEIKKGISIFTASMNRNEFLEKALSTWVKLKVDEIIIVDWSSKVPVSEMIKKFNDSRIIVVTIPDKKYWILSVAFNIAARCTSRSNILKLDSDILVTPDFLSKHLLNNFIFYAGDWRLARNENEKHTNGIMYVKRNNFFKANGYNEYIQTYGWDDCDLYDRLSSKLERYPINLDAVQHISHSYSSRNAFQKTQRLDVEIEKNRLISKEIKWNGPMIAITNKIVHNFNDITFILSPVISSPFVEIIEKCQEQAWKNRDQVRKFCLYIEVQNGLGNRLRAFASAFNIAKDSKRNLTLIWETNEHCEARISDLFDVIKLKEYVEKFAIEFQIIEDKRGVGLPAITKSLTEDQNYTFNGGIVYDYMDEAQKNMYIDDSNPLDIYIISACCLVNKYTDWQKESEFLRTLIPSSEVQKQINEFEKSLEQKEIKIEQCIGVHIRMHQWGKSYEDISNYSEDAKRSVEKWRSASHWKVFLNEIDKILAIDPKQKFFLCCDTESAYEELNKILPNIFIQTNKIYFDRSIPQVQNAVTDLTMLSRTKEILGSNWSTFTEIAHRLSGKKLRLAGKDF